MRNECWETSRNAAGSGVNGVNLSFSSLFADTPVPSIRPGVPGTVLKGTMVY
jgi:hypothetical protein